MADSYISSNPFRRKRPVIQSPTENGVRTHESAPQQLPIDAPTPKTDAAIKQGGKPVKHVRVQSPPPVSPEDDARRKKEHAPPPQGDEGHALGHDPFGSTITDESSNDTDEDKLPITGGGGRKLLNPFSKTLATLERTDGKQLSGGAPVTGAGKAAMDVEAFKRLLMTGSSDPTAPATSPAVMAQPSQVGLTDGNSTEASSVSRHSIFENIPEDDPESRRTSHEVSEPEEERKNISIPNITRSASGRNRPPPPSSRHGKLINMQLKDETRPQSLHSPYTPSPGLSPLSALSATSIASTSTQRSLTDLNKPLPPAPSRASHESDRESVFDREAAGKTPEPPSPSASVRRKPAPAPPSARRHGLPVSDPTHPPPKRLSIIGDESSSRRFSTQDLPTLHTTAPQQAYPKAPPPPPMRRAASVRNPSTASPTPPLVTASPDALPATSPPPAPPPTRSLSTRPARRPPSAASMDTATSSRRFSSAPGPPPPPHRPRGSSRNSLDTAPGPAAPDAPEGDHDILADLTALRREIDALRVRGGGAA